MSTFENRTQLWSTAREAIDLAETDLQALSEQLATEQPGSYTSSLADFLNAFGFAVDDRDGEAEGVLHANLQRFNAEDMRKGLRHGHVAIAAVRDAAHTHDLVAGAAAAVGLAAVVPETYGQISLVVAQNADELLRLRDEGYFAEPDCVFVLKGSSEGQGYQHTITDSGNHLAALTIEFGELDGTEIDPVALEEEIKPLLAEQPEPAVVAVTAQAIEISAAKSTTVTDLAVRIAELVQVHGAASAAEFEVTPGRMLREMLPNRVLARRVKSFTDTLGFELDRVTRQEPREPTPWGNVSHDVATALVGYPIASENDLSPDNLIAALTIAKAVAGAGLDVLGDLEFRGYVDGERVRALRERGLPRSPRRWLGVHPVLPPENGGRSPVRVPDVIVRGPGLPEPRIEDFIDDEIS